MTNVNESGRSMVEMLGVLAIIGVLSIGGIAGYTMAMNRYRANEVIDAASKMAIIAMTANGGAGADTPITSLAQAGIGTVPCLSTISANKTGAVTITLDSGCNAVYDVIDSIAGAKAGSAGCTKDACTLDFSGSTGSTSSGGTPPETTTPVQ